MTLSRWSRRLLSAFIIFAYFSESQAGLSAQPRTITEWYDTQRELVEKKGIASVAKNLGYSQEDIQFLVSYLPRDKKFPKMKEDGSYMKFERVAGLSVRLALSRPPNEKRPVFVLEVNGNKVVWRPTRVLKTDVAILEKFFNERLAAADRQTWFEKWSPVREAHAQWLTIALVGLVIALIVGVYFIVKNVDKAVQKTGDQAAASVKQIGNQASTEVKNVGEAATGTVNAATGTLNAASGVLNSTSGAITQVGTAASTAITSNSAAVATATAAVTPTITALSSSEGSLPVSH